MSIPSLEPFDLIVLAAGKGTRLKSSLPKVLHPIFGKPVLHWVLDGLAELPVKTAYTVVGFGREQVVESLEGRPWPFKLMTVVQDPPRGTGDAVRCVSDQIQRANGNASTAKHVVIMAGDTPLFRPESIAKLVEIHQKQDYALTVLAAKVDNPTGYGRIMTEDYCGQERVNRIVEEKDASDEEKRVHTINTGVYCLDWKRVEPLLEKLTSNNAQGEYYLTDLVSLANAQGLAVGKVHLADFHESFGVNSRADLAQCIHTLSQRAVQVAMENGVTVMDPTQTWLSPEASIGPDSVIYPGCYIEGKVTTGQRCELGPHTTLRGPVTLGNEVRVNQSQLVEVEAGSGVSIGPFAHLRNGVVISDSVRVGNFVEVKNSTIGCHTNAAHLAYIGDADLGSEVNMGAGSITANYDPIRDEKHRTILGDGVKVGCNAVLVAPLEVQERACVAAGSVITKGVEPWDLAIARQKQTAISKWVAKTTGQSLEGTVTES